MNVAFSSVAVVLWLLLGVAYLALVVGALVSIVGSTKYTPGLKAMWVMICIIAPFVGSLAWFIWGRQG